MVNLLSIKEENKVTIEISSPPGVIITDPNGANRIKKDEVK